MSTWDGQEQILANVARVFPDRRIVVIGAVAVAHHLRPFRGTYDLDLCVAIDAEEHARIALPPGWSRDQRMPHRWRTDTGGIIDVVPAADPLLQAGRVVWPDGSILDLAGIEVAMQDAIRLVGAPSNVHVATLRALFLCKVVAWLDRPAERRRDLGDVALMLDRYVAEDDPRLFDDPSLDPEREFDERASFLLGIDLQAVSGPPHRQRIESFASLVANEDRPQHAAMLALAPLHWQREPEAIARRMTALLDGLRHQAG